MHRRSYRESFDKCTLWWGALINKIEVRRDSFRERLINAATRAQGTPRAHQKDT